MTDHETNETDDDVTFSRRGVLKTVGAAGAIGAFGAETAAAKKPKEFIVGVKPGRADIAKRKARSVKREIDFGPDIGEAVAGRWPEEALKGLKNNPNVRYIEEDGEMHALSHPAELKYGVDRIDAEIAHAAGDTGATVDVAILDTGIDLDHPDLVGNLADTTSSSEHHAEINCDGSAHPGGSCGQDWDDDEGHGTHVAGITGAVANGSQVIGVAPGVTLHSVKVLDSGGSGSFSAIAAGLEWAADEGMDVANMSLGACCPDCPTECDDCSGTPSVMADAINYANSNNVNVVASAGNDGDRTCDGGDGDTVCSDNDCVGTPASHPGTIAVSSTDSNDNLSGFSSVGPEVDITAPGSSIESTTYDGGTGFKSGTSMSAPHVSGAAALLRADGVSHGNVLTELQDHAEDIGLPSYAQGAGLVDVADMLGENSANDLLEVETDFADDLDFTEATLNGDLTQLTGSASATVEFEWGKQGSGLPNTVTASGSPLSGPGSFEAPLTGLEEDTNYEFRAKATNAEGSTERGAIETFSTVDNLDPAAAITHSPPEPNPDQTVSFDGSGSKSGTSSDESGDSIVSYEWDLDNDGAFDEATGVTASRSYSTGGSKTVGLRVTDEFDQTDTATHTFYVNRAPTASFTISPDPVVRNEPATFDASGSSDPDGTVDLYEWDWDYDGTFTVDESTTSNTTSHTFTTGGEHTVALRVTDDDGATSDPVTETFTVHIRVAVDISPNGSGPNSINPNRRGNVPVAVLHTSAFNPPARLDHSTVHFGDPDDVGFDSSGEPEGGATPAHAGGHVEDVDGDGDMDSLFHFPTRDADFESDDTEGELVGLTNDGVPVFGTDDVNIVGRGGS